jgi:8-oxo-dGTP diphosphatase
MARSSKLVASKNGRVLLVRRRRDRLRMFPGGRKRRGETSKDCLRRELREELPKLKVGRLKLWKKVGAVNGHSGRRMSDAIFTANKAVGALQIGDKWEIDRAAWRKPYAARLTPTSRYIRNKLFSKVRCRTFCLAKWVVSRPDCTLCKSGPTRAGVLFCVSPLTVRVVTRSIRLLK